MYKNIVVITSLLIIILGTGFNVQLVAAHIPSQEKCEEEVCNVDILGLESPAYDPPIIMVLKGARVVFENHAPEIHTSTSTEWTIEQRDPEPDNRFETILLRNGEKSKEIVFTESGAYNYFCAVHPNDMRGEVIVMDQEIPEFPGLSLLAFASAITGFLVIFRVRYNSIKF